MHMHTAITHVQVYLLACADCPSCWLQAMLTAKDLPHCTLSRHLEKRLEQELERERGRRALSMAQSPSQVPVSTHSQRALSTAHLLPPADTAVLPACQLVRLSRLLAPRSPHLLLCSRIPRCTA